MFHSDNECILFQILTLFKRKNNNLPTYLPTHRSRLSKLTFVNDGLNTCIYLFLSRFKACLQDQSFHQKLGQSFLTENLLKEKLSKLSRLH